MSRVLEANLAAVAVRQQGVVTRQNLLELGLSPSGVDRRVRNGRLRPLHRGVYLALPVPLAHTREFAALLAIGPGATLSHGDALRLWGWLAGVAEGPVEVSGSENHTSLPGIRYHRVRLLPAERTTRDGIPVTTPARTLADVAQVLGARELENVVARAEREGHISAQELSELLACRRGRGGVRALRSVAQAPGGPALTRSPAEDGFLALVRAARLPPPECNVHIGRFELDFFWRRERLAVEVDGYRYHSSRQSFEGDRRRDAELVAAGITVLRLSSRQIAEQPMLTVRQITQALAPAGIA